LEAEVLVSVIITVWRLRKLRETSVRIADLPVKEKVKQSHYSPIVAQRVPGS
jgi:hypothetical protein